jgi:predicted transcriptional regulator
LAARTNSEKIEAAEREVLKQGHLLQLLEERYRVEVGLLQAETRAVSDRLHEQSAKIAVLEQRLSHAEKLLDEARTRRWQLWLAIFSAVLSATIALIVALVKR